MTETVTALRKKVRALENDLIKLADALKDSQTELKDAEKEIQDLKADNAELAENLEIARDPHPNLVVLEALQEVLGLTDWQVMAISESADPRGTTKREIDVTLRRAGC